ncbi:NAD(P)H-dependent oxidoreductase [Streptomyces sp. 891-h]|uniref:NAD(P)H-dependent oxidoreductase n=1 Tax=Streptomyces sp. 891-h TaxID=2720714 RepID=UPI001FA9B0CD|nr:NAD(P)H-dependent oxidoreductase [Streptomyces sp. 891-h]UNZ17599.1 oxidoreductase [Streptomyces sp. 891-h]
MNTLVVLAHPDLAASRVNAALARAARSVEGVTVHELYAAYPEPLPRSLDVGREQQLLRTHDRIVLQFPFYWYSAPPLLKQWLDEVFEHGFAYGSKGTALHGKSLRIATTIGSGAHEYRADGMHGFPVPDLLRPFASTARLTGMRFQEPFLVHGTHVLTDEELAGRADRYRRLLLGRPELEPEPGAGRVPGPLTVLRG